MELFIKKAVFYAIFVRHFFVSWYGKFINTFKYIYGFYQMLRKS